MPDIKVSVQVYRKSGNLADYYVQFKCVDRITTPHMFTDRFKAEYHKDHYHWVFNGGECPDLMAYDEESHPNYTEEQLKNPELRHGKA